MDHIITVSKFTRDEVLKSYPVNPDRITVIPNGVDRNRFNEAPCDEDATHLERLGVEQPYLLCVATVEPRKNLVTLVEAYARARQVLRAGGQKMPRLIITGQPGWGARALEKRLAEAGAQDIVRFTGYLDDEVLPALYRRALGLIFPSVYEGFGMPVLEAMACGCPTAISQASALPEVAGEAAAYFNPKDSSHMARVLTQFISDPHMRGNLREAGLERAKLYSWGASAHATLDVYRRILEERARGRNEKTAGR
jgi:glycosyltransferase involved in cell wall biosynthesis